MTFAVMIALASLTLAIMGVAVAGVIHAIRQEGRINAMSQRVDDHRGFFEQQLKDRDKTQDARHAENKEVLKTITEKLDRLLERRPDASH